MTNISTPFNACAQAQRVWRPTHVALALVAIGTLAWTRAGFSDATDVIGKLPLEIRAELATAGTIYSSQEVPALDPLSASFDPAAAQKYLQTDTRGSVYSAARDLNGMQATITIIQSADPKASADSFAQWSPGAENADWSLPAPVMIKVKGDSSLVARAQGGQCEFAVEVVSAKSGNAEALKGKAKELMSALLQNGGRFGLLDDLREQVHKYLKHLSHNGGVAKARVPAASVAARLSDLLVSVAWADDDGNLYESAIVPASLHHPQELGEILYDFLGDEEKGYDGQPLNVFVQVVLNLKNWQVLNNLDTFAKGRKEYLPQDKFDRLVRYGKARQRWANKDSAEIQKTLTVLSKFIISSFDVFLVGIGLPPLAPLISYLKINQAILSNDPEAQHHINQEALKAMLLLTSSLMEKHEMLDITQDQLHTVMVGWYEVNEKEPEAMDVSILGSYQSAPTELQWITNLDQATVETAQKVETMFASLARMKDRPQEVDDMVAALHMINFRSVETKDQINNWLRELVPRQTVLYYFSGYDVPGARAE